MEKFEEFAQWLKIIGLELGLLVAGLFGAIVSMPKEKELKFMGRVIWVISGSMIANYLTPIFSAWLNMGDNTKYGAGFLLGYLGIKSVELAIVRIKDKFKSNENN